MSHSVVRKNIVFSWAWLRTPDASVSLRNERMIMCWWDVPAPRGAWPWERIKPMMRTRHHRSWSGHPPNFQLLLSQSRFSHFWLLEIRFALPLPNKLPAFCSPKSLSHRIAFADLKLHFLPEILILPPTATPWPPSPTNPQYPPTLKSPSPTPTIPQYPRLPLGA